MPTELRDKTANLARHSFSETLPACCDGGLQCSVACMPGMERDHAEYLQRENISGIVWAPRLPWAGLRPDILISLV